ncbi:RNA polymerase sigma factor [Arcicella lustrica]|uniref:RNA polymerase sigma factor n=1 Tax=Arcicella lustrica TaxID=2984196 RepID=A0ABU5SPY8_9BACT|nr:RNA polymerase sigma factor [Arcicella sp. DC25W]MEA5429299.1 RNA polymerase sigma factor [Arcicella sp. DC25W]
MESFNDYSLWNALKQGDKDALSTLYFHFYNHLYEYGYRLCQDEHLVKDKIQDLFVKLWVKRDTLAQEVNVQSYLLGSLRNSLNEQYRTETNRGKIIQLYKNTLENEFSLEFELIKLEQETINVNKLHEALSLLTPKQREVIYLRYFEEVSYEEIAKVMDIQTKAVYKLSARALERLKEIMNVSDQDLLMTLILLQISSLKR